VTSLAAAVAKDAAASGAPHLDEKPVDALAVALLRLIRALDGSNLF
jgi:hypothetical protein